MNRLNAFRRIQEDITLRIKGGKFEKALPDPFVVFFPFTFHAVRRSPETDPFQRGFVRQVQNESQIRQKSAGCDLADILHRVKRDTAAETLVDEIRKEIAISEHRFSRLKCRPDHFFDQLRSGRHKQEHFRRRADFKVFAAKQNFPNDIAERRASRIAAKHRFDTPLLQPLGKEFDLCAFPATVAAVERDEHF